jgi:hypothetical protein
MRLQAKRLFFSLLKGTRRYMHESVGSEMSTRLQGIAEHQDLAELARRTGDYPGSATHDTALSWRFGARVPSFGVCRPQG